MVTAETTKKNQEYLKLAEKYVNQVVPFCWPVVASKGEGSYLYDMDGNAYLDFTSGIAVNNIGHCHPKVVDAVRKQAGELMHTSCVTRHPLYIELSKKLAEISPGRLDTVMLANTGAEVVEGSIKMARYVTGRPAIISFKGAFHGRTMLATALTTSKLYYREKLEPMPPSLFTVPYPYVFRSNTPDDPEACVEECIEQFDTLFRHFVHPEQVAAIIVEPVQGEGGYIVPPNSFLKKVREVADKHNIMLIVDEVQSGFGRTGKMFATEHSGVEPDVMLMAKGIANGMPVAGFITRKEIAEKWPEGRHGTTYGGNPLSCAASLATISVLREEKLVERSAKLGEQIVNRLKKFAQGKSYIGDVRGLGLMIAVEFNDKDGKPCGDMAKNVSEKCFENNLLVLTCGSHGQVIRLIPSLNVSDEDLEKGLGILEKAMKK